MKNTVPTLACAAALVLALQNPASAGVVFEIGANNGAGTSLGSTEILVEGAALKMIFTDTEGRAASSQDNGEMVYHADRREVVIVDHEDKEYFIMDEMFLENIGNKLGGLGEQMGGANGMMQQAYESAIAQLDAQGLSPEERAQAEQMLRNTFGVSGPAATSNGSSELEISKGGKTTSNGYPAVSYTISRGGAKITELDVADWSDLGAGASAQETLESFFDFFAAMSSGFGDIGFGPDNGAKFFDAMDKIGGFPVAGKQFEAGVVDEEWLLESITERDLDPDAFEPPAGYRLRTMGGF